jgi:hypothetical protein
MTRYEYKVVPASFEDQSTIGHGRRKPHFYQQLEKLMNKMGAGGWDYQRAETLPYEDTSAQGLDTFLVFRRRRNASHDKQAKVNTHAPLLLEAKMLACTGADDKTATTTLPDEPSVATEMSNKREMPLKTTLVLADNPQRTRAPKNDPSPGPLQQANALSNDTETCAPRPAQLATLSLADFAAPALDLSFWQHPTHPAVAQSTLARQSSAAPMPYPTANDPVDDSAPGPALRKRAAQIQTRNSDKTVD